MREVAQLQSTAGSSPFLSWPLPLPLPHREGRKMRGFPYRLGVGYKAYWAYLLPIGPIFRTKHHMGRGVKCDVTPISWV